MSTLGRRHAGEGLHPVERRVDDDLLVVLRRIFPSVGSVLSLASASWARRERPEEFSEAGERTAAMGGASRGLGHDHIQGRDRARAYEGELHGTRDHAPTGAPGPRTRRGPPGARNRIPKVTTTGFSGRIRCSHCPRRFMHACDRGHDDEEDHGDHDRQDRPLARAQVEEEEQQGDAADELVRACRRCGQQDVAAAAEPARRIGEDREEAAGTTATARLRRSGSAAPDAPEGPPLAPAPPGRSAGFGRRCRGSSRRTRSR